MQKQEQRNPHRTQVRLSRKQPCNSLQLFPLKEVGYITGVAVSLCKGRAVALKR